MGKHSFVDDFPKLVYTGKKNYQYETKFSSPAPNSTIRILICHGFHI